ncbi:MAG: polymorphic toxin-type HINT domain-containing protein [bacterium]|nr:polymorphic toxin-type HINT domain-containing protein [bacterium]
MKTIKQKYQKPKITVEKIEVNFFNSRRFNDSFNMFDGLTGEILAGCPNSCGCFPPGTLITLADGTYKKIEKVDAGDKVLSYDTSQKKFAENLVNKLLIHDYGEYECYTINHSIVITNNHRIWINDSMWKRVDELIIGDSLFHQDSKSLIVDSIEKQLNKTKVYNLHLDKSPHTFFASTILAHNSLPDLVTPEKVP